MPLPFAFKVFFCHQAWPGHQALHGMPQFPIVVKEILDIVDDQVKCGIIQLKIFLATLGTKPLLYLMAAVQAMFFCSSFFMIHSGLTSSVQI